jgi:hypothetical protein
MGGDGSELMVCGRTHGWDHGDGAAIELMVVNWEFAEKFGEAAEMTLDCE